MSGCPPGRTSACDHPSLPGSTPRASSASRPARRHRRLAAPGRSRPCRGSGAPTSPCATSSETRRSRPKKMGVVDVDGRETLVRADDDGVLLLGLLGEPARCLQAFDALGGFCLDPRAAARAARSCAPRWSDTRWPASTASWSQRRRHSPSGSRRWRSARKGTGGVRVQARDGGDGSAATAPSGRWWCSAAGVQRAPASSATARVRPATVTVGAPLGNVVHHDPAPRSPASAAPDPAPAARAPACRPPIMTISPSGTPPTWPAAPRARGRARPAGGAARASAAPAPAPGAGSRRAAPAARAGSNPHRGDERGARDAVGLQRFRLAAAAVQREHQLAVQPLAEHHEWWKLRLYAATARAQARHESGAQGNADGPGPGAASPAAGLV